MPDETSVVEVPPEVKERQDTDAYIAEREKQRNTPPPEPVVETTTPAEAAATPEKVVEKAVEEATDDYIRRRDFKEKQKRGKRGGLQAKIDEVAKLATELKEKLAAPPPPATSKPADAVPTPTIAAPTPKEAPKMADYTDIDKYNQDVALWAASQTKPVPVEVPKTTPVEPPKPDPSAAQRKEEFDRFLDAGKKLMVRYPDFNTTLEAAHVRGLTMSEQARIAITKLAAPEVAYWLAKPENDLAARNFMKLDDFQQVIEVGKIAERLTVKPSDFVSNAPAPGPRLNGQPRQEVDMSQLDTDEYIRQRRQARKAGIRR